MKTVISKISSKGQTTLPKEIREILGLDSGDIIQYEVEGNTIKMKRLDIEENIWNKSLESTLTEWHGDEDDDL